MFRRIKPLDDSSEQTLATELPVRTSNFFNFSQLLFNLELEEYWPIFKEHEVVKCTYSTIYDTVFRINIFVKKSLNKVLNCFYLYILQNIVNLTKSLFPFFYGHFV